jgi:Ca2+-dependent lipid-binding protein
MSEPIGHLTCIFKHADLTRDVKKIGRMDPYCRARCKAIALDFRTPECKNGSKNPKWNDPKFEIDIFDLEHEVKFKLLDADKVGKDVTIAFGLVKFAFFQGQDGQREIALEFEGKGAGKLFVLSHYVPRINHKESIALAEAERHQVEEKISTLNVGKDELQQAEVKLHQDLEIKA